MSIYDTASNHFPIMCAWAGGGGKKLQTKIPEEKYKCRYRLCLMATETGALRFFRLSKYAAKMTA